MKFRLNQLLGLDDQNVTIRQCLEKYYELSDKYISELVNQLSSYNVKERLYVYPDNDLSLAMSIKKITIAGFLIVYEFSKSPIVLVQLDLLLKNEKLCTPDVAFFIVSLINNILVKKDVHDFDDKIENINSTMNKIGTLNPRYFDINLFNVKTLELNQETIDKDKQIDSEDVVKNIVESFLKSLAQQSSDENNIDASLNDSDLAEINLPNEEEIEQVEEVDESSSK